MTYAEAVARLLALRGGEHAGMRPGLERIEGLLAALGHPEERFTIAQVGGTKLGKGGFALSSIRASSRATSLIPMPQRASYWRSPTPPSLPRRAASGPIIFH